METLTGISFLIYNLSQFSRDGDKRVPDPSHTVAERIIDMDELIALGVSVALKAIDARAYPTRSREQTIEAASARAVCNSFGLGDQEFFEVHDGIIEKVWWLRTRPELLKRGRNVNPEEKGAYWF